MTQTEPRINQNDRVLAYMAEFGSITQVQALADLGIMRLASRISDLKKRGYDIERRMVGAKNRYGETVYFAEYKMVDSER